MFYYLHNVVDVMAGVCIIIEAVVVAVAAVVVAPVVVRFA